MYGKFSGHCNRIRTVQSNYGSNFRNVNIMNYRIKFVNRWCQVIYVTKEFSNENHFNNYLNFMNAKYGYELDEVWNNNN